MNKVAGFLRLIIFDKWQNGSIILKTATVFLW